MIAMTITFDSDSWMKCQWTYVGEWLRLKIAAIGAQARWPCGQDHRGKDAASLRRTTYLWAPGRASDARSAHSTGRGRGLRSRLPIGLALPRARSSPQI